MILYCSIVLSENIILFLNLFSNVFHFLMKSIYMVLPLYHCAAGVLLGPKSLVPTRNHSGVCTSCPYNLGARSYYWICADRTLCLLESSSRLWLPVWFMAEAKQQATLKDTHNLDLTPNVDCVKPRFYKTSDQ